MTGRRFALIIGNSSYVDKNLSRLATPDADVERLVSVLRDPEIGGFDQVIPLINETATEVRRSIGRFFKNMTRDDLLLLYFSGHGVRDDRGELYLAVKDTEHDLLGATAIPASFITREMDASRSRRQILMLDCCHSGAFAQGAKAALGESVGTKAAFEGTGFGRVVLTATDATQFAWEGDRVIGQGVNSVFTHYVIEGLQTGQADMDNDGLITVDELYDYTYAKVVSETPKQTPGKWSYKQQGELVVARNPVIKPVSLPEALQHAVESPFAGVRAGAVTELGHLLQGSNAGLSFAAQKALETLANDDSRSVSAAAERVLRALDTPYQESVRDAPMQKPQALPPKENQQPAVPLPAQKTQPASFWRKLLMQSLPWWTWLGGASVLVLGLCLGIWGLGNMAGLFGSGPPTPTATATTTPPLANTNTPTPTLTPNQVIIATDTPGPATPTEASLPTVITDNGHEMVLVTAGSFEMGFNADDALAICQALYEPFTDSTCSRSWYENEAPIHNVFLDDYYMDRYEVTNAQYADFLNAQGNQEEEGVSWLDSESSDARIHQNSGVWQADSGFENHPVIEVSWYGAKAFCEWRNAALPTEAQWEKAARGPNSLTYPWGNNFDGTRLNFCDTNCTLEWANTNADDGYADTAPVGSYPNGASPYGLFDMAGNVWEWVADWYGDAYYGTLAEGVRSPAGPASGEFRVLRGGAWGDVGSSVRSALRGWFGLSISVTGSSAGFRCARSP